MKVENVDLIMDRRALRRHHKNRIRNKRIILLKAIYPDLEKSDLLKKLNLSINTPKVCSCFMCGNPRKHWKEKTRQELISKTSFTDEKKSLLQEHNGY